MKKQPIFIVGASGHAKVIIDIIEKEGKYEIIGLIDSNKNKGELVLGYIVLGKEENLPSLLNENENSAVIIAIGDNVVRHMVMKKLINLSAEISFATTIHPSAQIAKNVTIGKGVVIMAGAIVNSDSVIEDFVIINTKASIDHDGLIMAYSSLAPGVTLGGNVKIGNFSAVSIGATIKHNVSIGNHVIIGAGAVLLNDCNDNVVAYGVPAKEIRKRQAGEKYL
jgi:sugar O-acyltransferase (sialic acid O-acetyltransferase NeuD family)